MMTRRMQLIEMRVAENNRLEQAGNRAARSIRSVLSLLDKQLNDIDSDIDSHLREHFKQQRTLLDSVKGVGPVTILTLTAALPELGQLGRRELAKLMSVAPLPDLHQIVVGIADQHRVLRALDGLFLVNEVKINLNLILLCFALLLQHQALSFAGDA